MRDYGSLAENYNYILTKLSQLTWRVLVGSRNRFECFLKLTAFHTIELTWIHYKLSLENVRYTFIYFTIAHLYFCQPILGEGLGPFQSNWGQKGAMCSWNPVTSLAWVLSPVVWRRGNKSSSGSSQDRLLRKLPA